ncbi:MAG: hypothetical protein HY840_04520 [Bacteroidetes bacterium]|nr:hypothetical protein [Bacteroidota bacterium]
MPAELPSKVCTSCGKEKPMEEFSKNQYGKGDRILRRPVCKECYSQKVKINKKEAEEYERLHPRPAIGEKFLCPVCNKEKVRNFKADIVLDHSHIDGSVRGWICGSCNTSIGKFGEDIPTLQRAIEWIKKSSKGLKLFLLNIFS